jgi:hypothetical protein
VAERLQRLLPAWVHGGSLDASLAVGVSHVIALDPTCATATLLFVTPPSSAPQRLVAAVGPRLLTLVSRVQCTQVVAEAAQSELRGNPCAISSSATPLAVLLRLQPIPVLQDAILAVPGLIPLSLWFHDSRE